MFNGARVIGPAIGGYLLAAFGAGWCFFINGVSFLAVIGGLFLMRFPALPSRPSKANPLREILAGLTYVRGRRDILAVLGLTVIFGVLGLAYSSQLPAFVTSVLGARCRPATARSIPRWGWAPWRAGSFWRSTAPACRAASWSQSPRWSTRFALGAFAFVPSLNPALPLAFLLGLGFLMLFNNFNCLAAA